MQYVKNTKLINIAKRNISFKTTKNPIELARAVIRTRNLWHRSLARYL